MIFISNNFYCLFIQASDFFFPEAAVERKLREQVLRCYSVANPKKVNEIDHFMEKYKGKEHILFSQLRNKYGMKYPQCDALR